MYTARWAELKQLLRQEVTSIARAIPNPTPNLYSNSTTTFLNYMRNKLVMSGSHLANLYHAESPEGSDIDFFFKSHHGVDITGFSKVFGESTKIEYGTKFSSMKWFYSDAAYQIDCSPYFPKIQFISLHWKEEYSSTRKTILPQKIWRQKYWFTQLFDFMHCCAVYDLVNDQLYVPSLAVKAIEEKLLIPNPNNVKYLLSIMKKYTSSKIEDQHDIARTIAYEIHRISKFTGRGYKLTDDTTQLLSALNTFQGIHS